MDWHRCAQCECQSRESGTTKHQNLQVAAENSPGDCSRQPYLLGVDVVNRILCLGHLRRRWLARLAVPALALPRALNVGFELCSESSTWPSSVAPAHRRRCGHRRAHRAPGRRRGGAAHWARGGRRDHARRSRMSSTTGAAQRPLGRRRDRPLGASATGALRAPRAPPYSHQLRSPGGVDQVEVRRHAWKAPCGG